MIGARMSVTTSTFNEETVSRPACLITQTGDLGSCGSDTAASKRSVFWSFGKLTGSYKCGG